MAASNPTTALVLTALIAGAAGAGMASLLLQPSAAQAAPSSARAPDGMSELVVELRELTRSLSQAPRPTPIGASSSAPLRASTPAPIATGEVQPRPLDGSSAELAAAIRELSAAARSLGSPQTGPLVTEFTPIPPAADTAAGLKAAAEAWYQFNTTPETDMFGKAPADVLRTLGRPDMTSINNGGITWIYRDRAEFTGMLHVNFFDGYVNGTYRQ